MKARVLAIAYAVCTFCVFAASQTHINSDSTFYDRKKGYAIFTGHVFVDDAQYQLHAEKAYVYMDETNSLKRIVALGKVAITNEMKRAYGNKIDYYRNTGLVVLTGDEVNPAKIVDAGKTNQQTVVGQKIKFWTTTEQVEVIKATIVAPSEKNKGLGGMGVLK